MTEASVTEAERGSTSAREGQGDSHPEASDRRRRLLRTAGEPVVVNSAGSRTGAMAVIRDLVDGFAMGSIWRAFAWDEIQSRYRRSAIGLAWIVISYLIFVGAIAFFFGGFSSKAASSFTNYVAIGYAAFTFLIGNVTDGCAVFRTSATWIKSTSLPYSVHIYKSIARSLFPLMIQLATAAAVMLAMGWRPTWTLALAAPALIVYVVSAIWIQLLFGLFAARWRDIAHLMAAITRVLFFTTPIMWVYEERTGVVRRVADYNPLTHFIAVFRDPVLGVPASMKSWAIVGAWSVAGWAIAIATASVMRRRLPFWL